MTTIQAGLEGVVAARTRLSHVDGEAGALWIAGYPLEELAGRATFEEVLHLLWHDRPPTRAERTALEDALRARRVLPDATLTLLRAAAAAEIEPMDALRMGADSLGVPLRDATDEETALRVVAALPTILAAFWRLRAGAAPVVPHATLPHAANFLYMLRGEPPSPAHAHALECYWVTVCDHGFNASTFAARVIVSTASDLLSAVVGAIGALKGPLHGGAPGPALDTVLEIGTPERAAAVLSAKLAQGERLMGFGHRVYRVRDPRAEVLAREAERLFHADGDRALYELAKEVERTALALLATHKPGYRIQTNVEFYTALLLHGLGLPPALFAPTFALGRVAGWSAHALEQRASNRLIRPSAHYEGPTDRRWHASDTR